MNDTLNDYIYPKNISYKLTIKEMLDQAAETYSSRLAYIQIDSNKDIHEITFKELADKVKCLQEGIIQEGLSGSHIAVIGETSIEWITLYLAVVSGCGVLVAIDKEQDANTIAKQLNDADVEYVFCSDCCKEKVNEAISSCKGIKKVFRLSFEDMPKGNKDVSSIQIDPDKTCLILYTSGTTGANKGVMLTNRNIMSMVCGACDLVVFSSSSLSVLPIHHAYELHAHILCCLHYGTRVYINDDMKYFNKNIVHYGVEMMCVVPLMLEFLIRRFKMALKNSKDTNIEEIKHSIFGNLKMIISGGAPLKQEIVEFLKDIGINVYNGYGMTECSPVLAVNPSGKIKMGSVGKKLSAVMMRIADKNAEGYGELQVKGDSVMKGYYNDSDSTAQSFTKDGWFKTGDIGYIDKDDYVYIIGRKKNLIILSNGENVVPEEIEKQLYLAIPYIKECIVYAESDAVGLTAEIYLDPEFCVNNRLEDNDQKSEFIQNDINIFNANMAGYKRIYNVVIREKEFNKSSTQKIQRDK